MQNLLQTFDKATFVWAIIMPWLIDSFCSTNKCNSRQIHSYSQKASLDKSSILENIGFFICCDFCIWPSHNFTYVANILQYFCYFQNCRQNLSKLRIHAHNRNMFLLKQFGYWRDENDRVLQPVENSLKCRFLNKTLQSFYGLRYPGI